MDKIKEKIKLLPKTSGVYIFRNKNRKVIYVGKAVNLKNRVSSYFRKNVDSVKTEKLVENIADLEYLETDSGVTALLLEAELVRRYKPRYNIDLKDDKNYLFLKIPDEDFPLPTFVRSPEGDKSKYLGPYTDARTIRGLLKLLRKVYPFRSKEDLTAKRACLYYHLGQCPGVCVGAISKAEYAKNIRKIVAYFEGKGGKLEKEIESLMKKASKTHDFEGAAKFRDKLFLLKKIKTLHVSDAVSVGSKEDKALHELKSKLSLPEIPKRIECFDISNISGVNAVGSMVVFINGYPAKKEYRKFKIRTVKGPDDPAMMAEVLYRRVKSIENREKSEWPDLIVVDGGKGQLSVVKKALEQFELDIPIVGLAKQFETIFVSKQLAINNKQGFEEILLPRNSEGLYLLQRIRDEAHRFAITFFRTIHKKEATKSILDTIPGVGPKTKKKLIKEFGSVKGIKEASEEELMRAVGEKLVKIIKEQL